jgi:hypothetical protein
MEGTVRGMCFDPNPPNEQNEDSYIHLSLENRTPEGQSHPVSPEFEAEILTNQTR